MDERRYYGLDALRGAMMMLGIVLHGAMFYIVSPPPSIPIPTDGNGSYFFDLVFHFIHSFRMPLFFVLAGFFTSLLVDKRGVWGTYRNRVQRILFPLLAGVVTILPLTGLFMLDYIVAARFGVHEIVPDRALLRIFGEEVASRGIQIDAPGPGHLWFLYYLCYFYLLIPVCRLLVSAASANEEGVRKFLVSPLALPAFGLFTGALLWPFHGGQVHEGFILLKPHPPSLAYYGSFFVLGYLFHHHREVLLVFARSAGWCAALAAAMFPISLYASHLDNGATGSSFGLHLAAVVANGLCTWALIYAFIGAALRFFDHESPWTLYVSQSSYWVFLVHMPVVCLAGWWMVQYDLPATLKFLLVVSFTTVVCVVTYHYWVQRTWVSDFLNGRRFDLKWPWLAARR